MAIKVEKVTNIGLKMSDGTAIPVIRAVLSDYEGSHTASELQDMMVDIYNKSFGAVSVCGYATGGLTKEYINISDQDEYYGGDEGFKLRVQVDNTYNAANLQTYQWVRCYLYQDDVALSTSYAYTGYADYETAYMIILTDENYNLLKLSNQALPGFQIYSTHNIGTGIKNNIPVCGVWEDGEVATRGLTAAAIVPISGVNIKDDITNEIDPDPDKDPYDPEGTEGTGTGGGNGDHDLDSDDIDIPPLPTLSAVDTGFVTLFNPSQAQLKSLSDYLWSPPFDVDTIKKLFANPMDAFIGFAIVPVDVPSGGTKEVKVAGVPTGINMTIAARQFIEVNCGSINVNEYWGAYLDYSPYTSASLYLPYLGIHPIDIDDIMGRTITIKYHVDILTGSCVAYVKCGKSVLYSFIGECSVNIPMTSSDWTNTIMGALNIASSVGSMIASGGASAPSAAGTIAATAVNSFKPSIAKSGSMSGTGGMMAIQKPYLIITRPKQAIPTNQNKYMGYPSFITSNLGFLSGYTVIEDIHISGISATEEELNEIESLLKEGVIL